MAAVNTPHDSCIFAPHDLLSTLERSRSVSDNGKCGHIQTLEIPEHEIAVCVMMDSNCHWKVDTRNLATCQKGESNVLRLIAVRSTQSRNYELISISPFLRSRNRTLLRFVGGEDIGGENVLNLKDRPLWLGPFYKGEIDSNRLSVETIRCGEADVVRVPVVIVLSVSQDSLYGERAVLVRLGVCVPPYETTRLTGEPAKELAQISTLETDARRSPDANLGSASEEVPAEAMEVHRKAPSSGSELLHSQLRVIVESVGKDLRRLRELEDLLRYESDEHRREEYAASGVRTQSRLLAHDVEFRSSSRARHSF